MAHKIYILDKDPADVWTETEVCAYLSDVGFLLNKMMRDINNMGGTLINANVSVHDRTHYITVSYTL